MNSKYLIVAASAIMLTCSAAKADIVSTIEGASSGTTITCSGTYTISSGKITVPSGVTVKGPATFNFTHSGSDGFYIASGSTGVVLQSLTVTGANHGIYVYGSSCKVTSCVTHSNYNDGIEIIDSASKNVISGCTAYSNNDTQNDGNNADGFGNKQCTGTGNQWLNCTAYSNADDGFDFERSTGPIYSSGCVAYSNGIGTNGNGNGFKMGYKGYANVNTYVSCVAYKNTAGSSPHGFSVNNSTSKIVLKTCHSYSNGSADVLGNCVLTSCTMQN